MANFLNFLSKEGKKRKRKDKKGKRRKGKRKEKKEKEGKRKGKRESGQSIGDIVRKPARRARSASR